MTVDDQAVFRDVVHELIDAMGGFDPVGEAASGEEAIALAERLDPELVIVDVRMPGMDGIETARRLTTPDPSRVVVLVTSGDYSDVPAGARTCGAVALVLKQHISPGVLRGIWALRGPA